jgi:hypothetical protein
MPFDNTHVLSTDTFLAWMGRTNDLIDEVEDLIATIDALPEPTPDYYTLSGINYHANAVAVNINTFGVATLVPETTSYRYCVVANFADGRSTPANPEIMVGLDTGPPTLDSQQPLSLTWDPVSNATSYDIYAYLRGTLPTGYMASVDANTFTWTDDGTAAGSGSLTNITTVTDTTQGLKTSGLIVDGITVFNNSSIWFLASGYLRASINNSLTFEAGADYPDTNPGAKVQVLSAYDGNGNSDIILTPGYNGKLIFANLPVIDPGVAGALWNNNSILTVSAGA